MPCTRTGSQGVGLLSGHCLANCHLPLRCCALCALLLSVADEDDDEESEAKGATEGKDRLLAAHLDVVDGGVQLHIMPNEDAGPTNAK